MNHYTQLTSSQKQNLIREFEDDMRTARYWAAYYELRGSSSQMAAKELELAKAQAIIDRLNDSIATDNAVATITWEGAA